MINPQLNRWTWVWMRGPNKPAVQFIVSPLLIITTFVLFTLLLVSLLVAFVLSKHSIREFKQANTALQVQLYEQRTTIVRLEDSLNNTISKSDAMKTQMNEVLRLEQQLRGMIRLSSESIPGVKQAPTVNQKYSFSSTITTQTDVGGEFIAHGVSSRDIELSKDPDQLFDHMLDSIQRMKEDIPALIAQAHQVRHLLEITPTLWPTSSTRITSGFGGRDDPFDYSSAFHNGLDIGGDWGDTVNAAADGIVLESSYDQAKGNYIIVKHSDQFTTRYLHLSKRLVEPGQKVKQGEEIGRIGNTGRSKGAHLHIEVHKNEVPIDPLLILVKS